MTGSMIPPDAARRLADELAALRTDVDALKRSGRRSQLTYSSLQDSSIRLFMGDEVRARIGQQSDGQAAVTYMGGDPPPQPTQATVSARQLAFVVGWDGTFLDGAAKPSNFQRVDIHVSETAGSVPTGDTAWASLFGPGAVGLPGDVDAKYVRLVAVSNSLVASAPSIESTVTPLPADFIAAGSIGVQELAADIILTSRLRMLDGSGNTTLDLDGATGSALIAGEYRTGETGERIVINAENTYARDIRFYPTSGNRYATVGAVGRSFEGTQHGTIEMRAADPANGTAMTTRLWLLMNQLFLGYGHPPLAGDPVTPADWSGQVYIDPDTAYLRAGIPVIFSDINMGPFGINRIDFRHMNSAGNFIDSARLEHTITGSGTSAQPLLNGAGWNVGLRFGSTGGATPTGAIYVRTNDGATGRPIYASAFAVSSSRRGKQRVRDLPSPALDMIRAAPSKQWEYIPAPARTERVPRPDGDSDNRDPADKWETVDVPAEVPMPHAGPMAEDLPEWLVTSDDAGELAIDLRDMIGVLWKAVEEIADRLDNIEARLPARP